MPVVIKALLLTLIATSGGLTMYQLMVGELSWGAFDIIMTFMFALIYAQGIGEEE